MAVRVLSQQKMLIYLTELLTKLVISCIIVINHEEKYMCTVINEYLI